MADAEIILVDRDDATRVSGLSDGRDQPELANQNMPDWAAFLKNRSGKNRLSNLRHIEFIDRCGCPSYRRLLPLRARETIQSIFGSE
ncbi:MAG: hypothetical protein AAF367_20370 [Pseudomonadota bacterium]